MKSSAEKKQEKGFELKGFVTTRRFITAMVRMRFKMLMTLPREDIVSN